MAKLAPNGALDTAFGSHFIGTYFVSLCDGPAKRHRQAILLVAWFTACNGVPLGPPAQLDATTAAMNIGFNHTPGFNSTVRTLVLQRAETLSSRAGFPPNWFLLRRPFGWTRRERLLYRRFGPHNQ